MTKPMITAVDEQLGAFIARIDAGEVSLTAKVSPEVIYGGIEDKDLLGHLAFDVLDEQCKTGVFILGTVKFADGQPSLTIVQGTPGLGEVSFAVLNGKPFDGERICRQLETAAAMIRDDYRDTLLAAIRVDIEALADDLRSARADREADLRETRQLVEDLEENLARNRKDLVEAEGRCASMTKIEEAYQAFIARLATPNAPSL